MKTTRARGLAIGLVIALGLIWVGPTRVRSAPPPPPSLAVLPITVTLENATRPESADLASELAETQEATAFLRTQLARHAGYTLVDDAVVSRAVASYRGREDACKTPKCVLEIGKAARAELVLVTALTSPTSTSVLVHGVLLSVPQARVVHQELLDLRGKPDEMIRAGLSSLARRMSEVAASARTAARP